MPKLNYKHLGYFHAVAHAGNLTHAARDLNVSQSALSVQIKKLEDQLGHQLFDRRGGRLHLTEAGRIALDHADAIFAAGDELVGTLTSGQMSRPVLRLGAMATLSRNFQIGLLRQVLEEDNVGLVLRSGTLDSLLADLAALSLDVVILNSTAHREHEGDFRFHRLSEQHVSLIGTPERLGDTRDLADTLARHPLIVPSSHGSVRIGFDALVQKLGVRPRIVAEADDMAMLRLLTREDLGVAVLPPVVVRDELMSKRLIEAHQLPGVVETFYAVTVERRFPNPLLKRVLG